YRLGSHFAKAARHEDAVTELRKAKELNANLPLECMLASELAALGRWEEGVTGLQTAPRREAKKPSYPFGMGRIFRPAGKAEEAAKAFRKAAATNPPHHMAWEELAELLLDQGQFAEARAAIESRLALPLDDAQRRAQRRRLDHCNAMLAVEAKL